MRINPSKNRLPFIIFTGVVSILGVAAVLLTTVRRPPIPTSALRTAEITIDDNTFEPAVLTVKQGTKVTWHISGDDEDAYAVSANPHPGHNNLPGLHSDEFIGQGTYSYTFNQTGTFGYHNELIPSGNGTVIVVP